MVETMKVEQIDISRIKPYEKNPRNNEAAVDAVAASIKEFGWQQPIVVDKNYVIIAGHTRYEAAKKLRLRSIPCVVAGNLSDEKIRAYRLADNRTGELAEWNFALLEEELNEIIDINMEQFGFIENLENVDIDSLFEEAEPKEKKAKIVKCPYCGEEFET